MTANDQIKLVLDYVYADEQFVDSLLSGFSLSKLLAGISVAKDVPLEIAAAPGALAQFVSADADCLADVNNYIVTEYGASPDSAGSLVKNILLAAIQLHGLFGLYNLIAGLIHPAAPVAPVAPAAVKP
jgi:hypothetical protein